MYERIYSQQSKNQPGDAVDGLVTIREAAQILGVGEKRIRNAIDNGRVQAVRMKASIACTTCGRKRTIQHVSLEEVRGGIDIPQVERDPDYLTVREALRIFHVTEKRLRRAAESGTIASRMQANTEQPGSWTRPVLMVKRADIETWLSPVLRAN